jgi:hypothetical protein
MRKVTLHFPNDKSLRYFVSIIRGMPMEISYSTLTLTCDCGEAEIELAEKAFNAKVVEVQPKD